MIAVVADMLYLNQANDPVCGPLEITKVGEQEEEKEGRQALI